jgi:hypothetical protein
MTTSIRADVVYMRTAFDLKKTPSGPMLKITGRAACDVYLNSKLLRRVQMRARAGEKSKISFIPLRDNELQLLRKGPNTLAVVVKQLQNENRFSLTIVGTEG